MIGFVVYTVPTSDPPHVPPIDAEYPLYGITVNCADAPGGTVCGAPGLIDPWGPADGETV